MLGMIICGNCACKYKLKLVKGIATFYDAICDICEQEGFCTEIRDYGYPSILRKILFDKKTELI